MNMRPSTLGFEPRVVAPMTIVLMSISKMIYAQKFRGKKTPVI